MTTTNTLLRKRSLSVAIAVSLTAASSLTSHAEQAAFDVVFKQARVIDPETRLDAVRDVGISGKTIAAVSTTSLKGNIEIDAKGKVLGPGFIDLHVHGINVPSFWMQAFDGVTTALELEAGGFPIKKAYANAAKLRLPLNYGFSASWAGARLAVADGIQDLDGTMETATKYFGWPRWSKLLPPEQSTDVVKMVEREMLDGGIGIGVVTGYAPETNREEYVALANLAAKYDVPTYTHLRAKNTLEPDGAVEGFVELLGVAAGTGARMHICHINSTSLRKVVDVIPLIEKAQGKKLLVTTEAYPFGAGSTVIGAPFLKPENLPQVGIQSSNIYYLKTKERIATNERLREIRSQDPGGHIVVHYLDEKKPDEMKFIDTAILFQDTMIASDAMPFAINGREVKDEVWPLPESAYSHPRSAATFSTVIARYVREQQSMSLIDVFRRGSLLPANLVATASIQAKRKGRIQPGMDADIIVFELSKVEPRADYVNPRQPSVGMEHVMVNGQFIIRDGNLLKDSRPGEPIMSTIKNIPQ